MTEPQDPPEPPEPQTGPQEPQTGPPEPRTGQPPEPVVDSLTSEITAGPGGVMTDEVGVITGELTLRTELAANGGATLRIQYRDADEWYVVTGGRTTLLDPSDLTAIHELATGLLDRPAG